jgi:hypothetical protein
MTQLRHSGYFHKLSTRLCEPSIRHCEDGFVRPIVVRKQIVITRMNKQKMTIRFVPDLGKVLNSVVPGLGCSLVVSREAAMTQGAATRLDPNRN